MKTITYATTLAFLSLAVPPSTAENGAASPTMSYAIWAAGEFEAEELAQPTISGKLADPDGDGFNNLMEYALDGDPTYSDRFEIEPSARIVSGALVMDFKRDTSKSDIQVDVLSSTNLKTWRATQSELISTRGSIEKHRASTPIKGTRSFLKIRVISP